MPDAPQDRRKWSVLSGLFLVYMASNGITLHTLPQVFRQHLYSLFYHLLLL